MAAASPTDSRCRFPLPLSTGSGRAENRIRQKGRAGARVASTTPSGPTSGAPAPASPASSRPVPAPPAGRRRGLEGPKGASAGRGAARRGQYVPRPPRRPLSTFPFRRRRPHPACRHGPAPPPAWPGAPPGPAGPTSSPVGPYAWAPCAACVWGVAGRCAAGVAGPPGAATPWSPALPTCLHSVHSRVSRRRAMPGVISLRYLNLRGPSRAAPIHFRSGLAGHTASQCREPQAFLGWPAGTGKTRGRGSHLQHFPLCFSALQEGVVASLARRGVDERRTRRSRGPTSRPDSVGEARWPH